MSKSLIRFLFIISITGNILAMIHFFIQTRKNAVVEAFVNAKTIKNISADDGSTFLINKLKTNYPKDYSNKNYYFISIWNTLCKPCIKEMPLLDTLSENIARTDFSYLFLTENTDKSINEFRNKHKIYSKNFIYINDADVYISSILKTLNLKYREYPIQLIIDKKGKILFHQIGTFESSKDTSVLKYIKNLKLQ